MTSTLGRHWGDTDPGSEVSGVECEPDCSSEVTACRILQHSDWVAGSDTLLAGLPPPAPTQENDWTMDILLSQHSHHQFLQAQLT